MDEEGHGADDGNASDDEAVSSELAAVEPAAPYQRLDDAPVDKEELDEIRQLRLDPGVISNSVCVCVLLYDVLGLVVCFIWGMIALRLYSVSFGFVAKINNALYILSCIAYGAIIIISLSRAVFVFFPSEEEMQFRDLGCRRTIRRSFKECFSRASQDAKSWMELTFSSRTCSASEPLMSPRIRMMSTFGRKPTAAQTFERMSMEEAQGDKDLANTNAEGFAELPVG